MTVSTDFTHLRQRVEALQIQATMLADAAGVAMDEGRSDEALDLGAEAAQRARWAGDIEEECRG